MNITETIYAMYLNGVLQFETLKKTVADWYISQGYTCIEIF